jgi:hypothetical protein
LFSPSTDHIHFNSPTCILPGLFATFDSLPTHGLKDPFPRALRRATLELASNNLICSVALTGVLALQAGRFWAEKSDTDDEESVVESDNEDTRPKRTREVTPVPENRNTQGKQRIRVS